MIHPLTVPSHSTAEWSINDAVKEFPFSKVQTSFCVIGLIFQNLIELLSQLFLLYSPPCNDIHSVDP